MLRQSAAIQDAIKVDAALPKGFTEEPSIGLLEQIESRAGANESITILDIFNRLYIVIKSEAAGAEQRIIEGSTESEDRSN